MPTSDNILHDFQQLRTTPKHLSENAKNAYVIALQKYSEVELLILKTIDIVDSALVPKMLSERFKAVFAKYAELRQLMLLIHEPQENSRVNSIFLQIDDWHRQLFEISSGNYDLMVINAIANYNTEIADKYKDELFKIQLEYKNQSNELEKKQQLVDEILKKLETPSTEQVLTDYARIYKADADSKNWMAQKWLWAAIILVLIFIVTIILSIAFEWFPVGMKLEDVSNKIVSSHEIINIPILLTKAFLISLILFVIVFCFKQYSIFKNLFVMNQQKMNAFNSYRMFEAAIGDGDTESKKALLMSLAKTIHESQHTGFLNGKETAMPSVNNIDIGKLG